MASPWIRTVLATLAGPLRALRACTPAPRAFSTALLGVLRGAGPAGVGLGPGPRPLLPGRAPQHLPPALGFKTKSVLKRRCKDCYLVKRRGRWFVYCRSNPRHKQRQLV